MRRSRIDPSAPQPDMSVNLDFAIPAWAAFAPGLVTPAQWAAWAQGEPKLPCGPAAADLPQVPAMVRRRLSPLGRTALQAAFEVHVPAADVPVVFGSRYGDAGRSLELLAELVRGEPLSPTAFGLSVHNAIGAMYAIIRGDRANHVAVAAGDATPAAALIEAAGLLADGAPEVLVVHCEAPLPEPYAAFDDHSACLFAWAWRVTRPVESEPRYSLTGGAAGDVGDARLPHALDLMRFVASGAAALCRSDAHATWTWRRHDA